MGYYQERIAANLKQSPDFNNGFSNHLSMLLWSWQKIGLPDSYFSLQRIKQHTSFYQEWYGVKPTSPDASYVITKDNWKDYLGEKKSWKSYLLFFESSCFQKTTDLDFIFSHLCQKPDTALFHALIRYSIARQSNNMAEAKMALAYWAANYDSSSQVFSQPLTTYAQLESVLQKVIWFYCASGDFVALHLITSYAACLYLPKELSLTILPFYAMSLQKYANGFSESEVEPVALDAELWNKVKAHVTQSEDEHVVKVVYALRQLSIATNIKGLGSAVERTLSFRFL